MENTIQRLYQAFLKSRSVCTDSRKVKPGELFFALKGDQFDGNKFALQALADGASLAVVDDENLGSDDRLVIVPDALKALQKLASIHRDKMSATVIGITGTNGKTTTKELVSAVLSSMFKTISTKGNLNNHIGVPLTLLSIQEDTEMAVIEMGANHQGEIRMLSTIARPEYGLITNIGKAHLEGFGGFTGVINAKSELYSYIDDNGGKLLVHANDPLLMTLSANISRFTYGADIQNDVYAELVSADPFVHLLWECKNMQSVVKSQLIGEYNAMNIMAAIAVGCYFGVDKQSINQAITSYKPANFRSQLIDSGRNRIVMDAYNANPVSMEAAIRNFDKMRGHHYRLIIGDMLELGSESDYEHAEILKLLTDLDMEQVILVGKHFGEVYGGDDWLHFENTEKLYLYLEKNPITNCDVLLKGSRGIGLEKILPLL